MLALMNSSYSVCSVCVRACVNMKVNLQFDACLPKNRGSPQTALKLARLYEQLAPQTEKVQNAKSLLNNICWSPSFGHHFCGSVGHHGLIQLSKLASSNPANDSLVHLPREREGEAALPRLAGQQCISQ